MNLTRRSRSACAPLPVRHIRRAYGVSDLAGVAALCTRVPLQCWPLTPELQWQSRGKRRILSGCALRRRTCSPVWPVVRRAQTQIWSWTVTRKHTLSDTPFCPWDATVISKRPVLGGGDLAGTERARRVGCTFYRYSVSRTGRGEVLARTLTSSCKMPHVCVERSLTPSILAVYP